jgi:hypothetical protein
MRPLRPFWLYHMTLKRLFESDGSRLPQARDERRRLQSCVTILIHLVLSPIATRQ